MISTTIRRAGVIILAGALVASGSVASAAPPEWAQVGGRVVHCTDRKDEAISFKMRVDGETATGHYALPNRPATGLVVFAHGYGHTSFSWINHMRRAARDHGVIAVTMDYRGIEISPDSNDDGLPESRGWNVMKGAQDTIAAASLFERTCRSIEHITIFGVSMGSNTAGLALALSKDTPRSDGAPLFDYWVNVEGAVNVTETYLGARALAPVNATAANARADIEAEAGGPIEQQPDAYRERTVVARIADIAAAGVKGVINIHGLDDGLIPYNQAREIVTLLRAASIPSDMFTIGRRSPESEQETTLTGYVGTQIDPNYKSPLAGHASEKSNTHIVMVTAFERLWALMDEGQVPGPHREFLVDGEAGTYPPP